MRILLVGQAAFAEQVLAGPGGGRARGGRRRLSAGSGRQARSGQVRGDRPRHPGAPVPVPQEPRGARGVRARGRRSRAPRVRHADRPRAAPPASAPDGHLLSPVAAAALSRRQRDPVAAHPRRDPQRASPSSGPTRASTPDRSCCSARRRPDPTTPPARSTSRRSSRSACRRCSTASQLIAEGRAPREPQDERLATLRSAARRRARGDRLVAAAGGGPRPDPRLRSAARARTPRWRGARLRLFEPRRVDAAEASPGNGAWRWTEQGLGRGDGERRGPLRARPRRRREGRRRGGCRRARHRAR